MRIDPSIITKHNRYLQQARWTQNFRDYLFNKCSITSKSKILEIGCGTGAISKECCSKWGNNYCGLDIDLDSLLYNKQKNRIDRLIQGDGYKLPFANGYFSITMCHFLLLWLAHPQEMLCEMKRVTGEGGAILALAEPDYENRIDFPPELIKIGRMQAEALSERGANVSIGHQLGLLFNKAGLENFELGLMGGQWIYPTNDFSWHEEHQMLKEDLQSRIAEKDWIELDRINTDAWQNGSRILFVPTFYAIAHNK